MLYKMHQEQTKTHSLTFCILYSDLSGINERITFVNTRIARGGGINKKLDLKKGGSKKITVVFRGDQKKKSCPWLQLFQPTPPKYL